MKNQYGASGKQWYLVALWVMSFVLSARAQTVLPPVIQWQRISQNTDSYSSSRVIQANDGGYAVSAGSSVTRLTANGDQVWSTIIRSFAGNIASLNIVGIAPATDEGFVVLASDDSNSYLTKLDGNGNRVWVKGLTSVYSTDRFDNYAKQEDMIATPDGGYLVVGDVLPGNQRVVIARKIDKDGNTTWRQSIFYKNFLATQVSRVTNSPDGGYVLVGQVAPESTGWAAKLDDQGSVTWQKIYPERKLLDGVIPSPYFNGSFIASGVNNFNAKISNTLNLDADGSPGGGFISADRVNGSSSSIVRVPASPGKPSYHTVLDKNSQNAGDFRLINLAKSDQFVWAKTFGGSGVETPQDMIATDDGGYLLVGTTTSTDGDVQGNINPGSNTISTWIVKLSSAAPANALTLTQPTYNCQTGAITFNTTGGDGSAITYTAPGISRANATDNVGTVEAGLRGDPKPITVTATQSGQTASYTFDFRAFCTNNPQPPQPPVTPPATGGTLTLIQPTYNCQTGAITFNTTGGNGSSIVYTAPGITRSAATDNTGYIEAGLRGDPKPITITATQSGQTVSYIFDFGAFCRIRPAALPPVLVHAIASQTLTVGQPVTGRSIDLGSAFLDPTVVVGPYMSDWQIQINGIPFGLTPPANDQNLSVASPQLYLTGTPTITGVYTLTIIARTVPFPDQPVTTTFTITVVPASATTSTLTLLTPAYDCGSGAFTFRSSGGNGSPIEYQAAGITGWTTNPNQFVDKDSRTANDVKPFTLMARQNGQTATLTWDLKAACGRANARLQAEPTDSPLKLTVLGNPVHEQLRVQIQGANGQPVTLRLTDLTGRLVESRMVSPTDAVQEEVFELHSQPAGLLLLRASSGTRQHTVKVLRQ